MLTSAAIRTVVLGHPMSNPLLPRPSIPHPSRHVTGIPSFFEWDTAISTLVYFIVAGDRAARENDTLRY